MVEDVHTGMVRKDVERLIAALHRLDDAAERERHREPMLLDVERDVSELVLSFPRHVETALGRGAGLADLAFLIDRFALAAAISVQCPMLLGETSSARNTAARRAAEARRLLDDLTPSRLLQNAPSLDQRRAFLRSVRELQAIIGSRPELLATLAARSVDPRAFIESVRDEREAPLLLIPHTP